MIVVVEERAAAYSCMISTQTFDDPAEQLLYEEYDLYEPRVIPTIPCPNPHCSERFIHEDLILQHMNDPNFPCYSQQPAFTLESASNCGFNPQEFYGGPSCVENAAGLQYHPLSAYAYGKQDNTFQRLAKDPLHSAREHSTYYPFPDRDEWEVGKFLTENMTQTEIDKYLKLAWVSSLYLEVYR